MEVHTLPKWGGRQGASGAPEPKGSRGRAKELDHSGTAHITLEAIERAASTLGCGPLVLYRALRQGALHEHVTSDVQCAGEPLGHGQV